jgi:hypothetical protein
MSTKALSFSMWSLSALISTALSLMFFVFLISVAKCTKMCCTPVNIWLKIKLLKSITKSVETAH